MHPWQDLHPAFQLGLKQQQGGLGVASGMEHAQGHMQYMQQNHGCGIIG